MPPENFMISRDDYLAQDAQSDQKLEFFEGQIFAMAGGTFTVLGKNKWLLHVYSDLAAKVVLESLDVSLPLEAIYQG